MLSPMDHKTTVGVGQYKTHKLILHGFYTSKTRPLQIQISSTPLNGIPLLAFINITVSWTYCGSVVNMSQASYTPSLYENYLNIGWNATFFDVLEDIHLSITYKVSQQNINFYDFTNKYA